MPYIGNVTTSSNVNGSQINNGTITGDKLSLPFDYDSATLYLDNTNNRVGILTASPSSTLTVGTGGVVSIPLASAATPSLVFGTDTNTGIYSPGADQVAISTDGSGRLFVDASGRVGVGTAVPGVKFTVVGSPGDLAAFSNATDASLVISANSGVAKLTNDAASGSIAFGTGSSGTERLRITSAGLVGIGTTSPSVLTHLSTSTDTQLRVESTSASGTNEAAVQLIRGSNQSAIKNKAGGLEFFVQGLTNEVARIDSSGSLLVGTSTDLAPDSFASKVQVVALNGTASISARRESNDSSSSVFNFVKTRSTSLGGSTAVQSDDGLGNINFYAANGTNVNTAAARISAAIDGSTISTSSMPGRLVFSTTADGASSPTERFRISSTGAQSSVIPGGSTLYPSFDCRAWVNFNGTGTVAIRGSGNVSSITDNGTGNYMVNFTTAMPDANYAAVGGYGNDSGSTGAGWWVSRLPTYATGSCQVLCGRPDTGAYVDATTVSMAFFR